MTDDRVYYCDYCGRELSWDEVTYDERHVVCWNLVGGEHAGQEHARIRALEVQEALDAKVRDAARDVLTVLEFQGNRHRTVEKLRAALAEREGKGE